MYSVVCFAIGDNGPIVMRQWVKSDEQVIAMLKDGFVVYRVTNGQLAELDDEGDVCWYDLPEQD